ncbi:MAG TPA: serine hydrolase domain-containing protein [Pyrinomonadaceae bacterium]|nr:serine hydrolase domain-containing protein [Pyrinomonadaceae bacterium]
MNLTRRKFLSTSAKTAVAVVVLRSFVPARALAQAASLKPVFARLDEYIARHMTETGAPGMTLALANREGLLRASTYGYADTKAGLRVAPETMFEIGSISKSFVALVLMQLRDEGKLDLNKPIVEYLPWLKINSKFEPVTTHHILTHSAGLPAAPLLLDALLAELWTAYAPGKHFLYSNTGYNILGFLIEALDKRPFVESMRTRMLVPLGMTASASMITNDLRKLMAVGYEPLGEGKPFPVHGPLVEAQWIEVDVAAGSIASTPADMAKYMRMLLNRGVLPKGRLISEESFALFTKPEIDSPFRGEPGSYGYGLWISDIAGHTRLRHTGGMVAFSSSIDIDLTGGLGAFASVNANLRGYRPVAVTRYAVELLNASLASKPLPDAPAPPLPPDEVKNAADYAGVYTSPDGKKLELVVEGDKLILVHGAQRVVLERAGGDRFIVKHPDLDRYLLGFVRENQQVTQAYHGADWYAGAKYMGPKSFETKKEFQGLAGHYYNDSPWYGDFRIVLRNGQLYIDGVQQLAPRADGKFGLGDPEGPDWISFEPLVDGRAMRLSFSGIPYRRTFTP